MTLVPYQPIALNLGRARWGLVRDLHELLGAGVIGWVVVASFVALPVAALVVAFTRRKLAFVAFGLWLSIALESFLYYATDWWSNPGLGIFAVEASTVGLGWLIVLVAASQGPSPRRGHGLSDDAADAASENPRVSAASR